MKAIRMPETDERVDVNALKIRLGTKSSLEIQPSVVVPLSLSLEALPLLGTCARVQGA